MPAPPSILVFGAGTVGCFVGGRLQAAGATVRFVGRPRVLDTLRTQGLRLTDLDGADITLAPDALSLHEQAPCGPALALLCVKSADTAAAAAQLAECLPAGSVVLSLQNGVSNPGAAAQAAPGLDVLPGVVGFNVVQITPGHYHRGTSGILMAGKHPLLASMKPLFRAAGLGLTLHDDMLPWQWGKLLLNLNNPLNAISGLPLREELMQRDLRYVLAALQEEALSVLHAADIRPARLTPLPASWMPGVLRLPNPLFRLLSGRMLRIDARARSSMADDLVMGRPLETDAICGEVVRLATELGLQAPLNARMGLLMQSAEPPTRPRSGKRLRKDLGLREY